MSNFRIRTTEDPGELVLGGDLTIGNAAAIRDALVKAFDGSEQVLITLEDDAKADLSFLQLLCSAHRTAAKEQKTFCVHNLHTPGFEKMVGDSGYGRKCGCDRDRNGSCLWIREDVT